VGLSAWFLLGLPPETWKALTVSAISGFIFGFIASLLANAVYRYMLRPDFTIELDDSGPAPGVRPSIGPYAFFHIIVVSSSHRVPLLGTRRIPQVVKASITIQDALRNQTFISKPARWSGWPEPIALVPEFDSGETALIPYADTKEIARQRTFNFESPGDREQIDLVLKVEGQSQMYFWNNDNYRNGWLYEGHRLEQGDYHVRVRVECEGRAWMQRFSLSNGGTSWSDIRIVRLPTTN
jgi:hypothetical protein